MTVCPGPCNDTWRRAIYAHLEVAEACRRAIAWLETCPERRGPPPALPDLPNPEAVNGDPIWCRRCRGMLRGYLTELGYLADLPPESVDLGPLLVWAQGWEDAARSWSGLPTRPPRGRTGLALATTLAWLAAHSEMVLAHPELGARFGYQTMRRHQDALGEITAALKVKRP